jgi:hypothetical protein
VKWKPLMSKSEAEEYTINSYYQGQDFYHGTSRKKAESIISKGVVFNSDIINSYGNGFYLAFTKSDAVGYMDAYEPALLTVMVRSNNPKIFQSSIEFLRFQDRERIPYDDEQAKVLSRLLISQGFDSIEIHGVGTLVIIFSKEQVVVYNMEKS